MHDTDKVTDYIGNSTGKKIKQIVFTYTKQKCKETAATLATLLKLNKTSGFLLDIRIGTTLTMAKSEDGSVRIINDGQI